MRKVQLFEFFFILFYTIYSVTIRPKFTHRLIHCHCRCTMVQIEGKKGRKEREGGKNPNEKVTQIAATGAQTTFTLVQSSICKP